MTIRKITMSIFPKAVTAAPMGVQEAAENTGWWLHGPGQPPSSRGRTVLCALRGAPSWRPGPWGSALFANRAPEACALGCICVPRICKVGRAGLG